MAVIDLSQLPAPQIVDVPDFETLLAERKAEFVALHPKEEQEEVTRARKLKSNPPLNCCRRMLTVSCFCASALTKPRRR
ncbi:putative baseplate J-like protein [Escherichia coli P0302308.5]|nr:putative baseplate J-like protein [Escherichia coli P0302308.5]